MTRRQTWRQNRTLTRNAPRPGGSKVPRQAGPGSVEATGLNPKSPDRACSPASSAWKNRAASCGDVAMLPITQPFVHESSKRSVNIDGVSGGEMTPPSTAPSTWISCQRKCKARAEATTGQRAAGQDEGARERGRPLRQRHKAAAERGISATPGVQQRPDVLSQKTRPPCASHRRGAARKSAKDAGSGFRGGDGSGDKCGVHRYRWY